MNNDGLNDYGSDDAQYGTPGFSGELDDGYSVPFPDEPYGEVTNDEKNLSLLSHLGPLAVTLFSGGSLGFVVPLVVLFHKNDQKEWVKSHAKEAANFNLTFLLFAVGLIAFSFLTLGFGLFLSIPLLGLMWVGQVIFGIIAALASSRGEAYRYPLTIRFLK